MAGTDLNKKQFFKLLNLKNISPKNNSSKIFRNPMFILPNTNADLVKKNNSITTGYENFHIKNGSFKLFPYKDFDFCGSRIVCQKCYVDFSSRSTYKSHIGSSTCVKPDIRPNLIYLKFKKSNAKRYFKDQKNNTTKTVMKRRNIKEKVQNVSEKKDNEPSVKIPRGRPSKDNVEPKKRGRPKKCEEINQCKPKKTDSIYNLRLNYIYSPVLHCHSCDKNFITMAEWKYHRSEHLIKYKKSI